MKHTGLAFGVLGLGLVACASFRAVENDEDEGTATATAGTQFDLVVPTNNLTLMHGATVTVNVTVARKNKYGGEVDVTIGNAPAGLLVTSLKLGPSETSGTLTLAADASVPQGDLAGLTVDGTVPDATDTVSAPIHVFVRGAPGELDTTFAAQGVLDINADGSANGDGGVFNLGVDSTGRIYLGTGTISLTDTPSIARRYTVDGAPDVTFGTDGSVTSMGASAMFLAGRALYFVSSGPNIQRFSLDGVLDTTFGEAGKLTSDPANVEIANDIAVSQTGNIAVTGMAQNGSGMQIRWFTSDGTDAGTTSKALPSTLQTGVYSGSAFLAVGKSSLIRLTTAGGSFDSTFGVNKNGYANVVASTVDVQSMAVDADGRYLISGYDSTNKSFSFARVLEDGTIDPDLGSVSGQFTTTSTTGAIRVDSSGHILQAATTDQNQCVVVRYNSDGTLDNTFGNANGETAPVNGCSAKQLWFQPDGRIIVGGGGTKAIRFWN
ncbi:MAG: hypothetical protein FWD69_16235 [Polyangiaceae bacterium]|nr:hypothetical protein [Polyangiaceae bacterium]